MRVDGMLRVAEALDARLAAIVPELATGAMTRSGGGAVGRTADGIISSLQSLQKPMARLHVHITPTGHNAALLQAEKGVAGAIRGLEKARTAGGNPTWLWRQAQAELSHAQVGVARLIGNLAR